MALLAVGALTPGCDRDPIPTSATDKLVIGVSAALSGSLQAIGAIQLNATRVAEQHINASGGVLGRPVSMPVIDDKTTPAGFQQALDQIFALNPAAVIGPTGSPQAIEGQNRILMQGLLQISSSASTPTMTNAQSPAERTFFRTAASHALQARAFAELTKGTTDARLALPVPRFNKAIVVHSDDDYGNPIAKSIAEHMMRDSSGRSVVLDVSFPTEQKGNYDAEATQVVNRAAGMGADCQILVAFPPTGAGYMLSFAKAVEQNTSRDWSTFQSFGSNGVFQIAFIERSRTGSDNASTVANRMIGLSPESNPPGPQYVEFENLYRANIENAPNPLPAYASNQFDAAILLALAMEKAGTSTNLEKLRASLFEVANPPGRAFGPGQLSEALAAIRRGEDIDYHGASGALDFDENGDVTSDYIIWTIDQGALKVDRSWRILASSLK